MRRSFALLATLALATTASAEVLIIDDDGGVGVDYISVVDAVAAANSGDRLLVYPGLYPADVSSDKGLTIIGVGAGVFLAGDYFWHDLPVNRELRIVGLKLGALTVQDCAGPVLLTELLMNDFLSGGSIGATGCADVRVRNCTISTRFGPAVRAEDSRVELVGCQINGVTGSSGSLFEPGGDGGDAVHVRSGSLVTVHATMLEGGSGGDTISMFGDLAGNGGLAAHVFSGGELILSGTSAHEIRGGPAGTGNDASGDGIGGDGIRNDGVVRYSGVVILGGLSIGSSDGVPLTGAGLYLTPTPNDPFMEVVGEVRAGQPLQFVVHGEPGGVVRLLAGRRPSISNVPGSPDPRLTQPFRSIWIGNLPASGELVHNITLPPGMNPGDRFVIQAKITTSVVDRFTNSGVLLVR